jgi:membrane associated rhomboid family serine protease
VRVTPSRSRADEWAVVLAAADVAYELRESVEGWALVVPAADADAALDALAAYDRENAADAPRVAHAAAARPVTLAGAYVALLLLAVFALTGSRADRSVWFERGSADASRLMAGEWWRAVTALTLHADAPHVLGNAVAGALLISAVCQATGTGVGLWLVLLAGAAGNVLTAAAQAGPHVSVGASTAIFGAIGILVALRVVTPARVSLGGSRPWVVLAASVLLLVLFGTGPNVDVLAHLFGLLAGGVLGVAGASALRRSPPAWLQALLAAMAAAAVAGAWRLAFS